MKILKNRKSLAFVCLTVVLIGCFQNCSPKSFGGLSVDELASKYGWDDASATTQSTKTAEVTIGSTPLPKLKMIFVVDNSYTMAANQIKLADGLQSMFTGSNSNLTPFDTTAYLISTAQATLPFSSNADKNLMSLTAGNQISDAEFAALTAVSVINDNRTLGINGKIPGDVLGYRVDPTPTGGFQFLPAPLLGIADVAGVATPVREIHKSANVDTAGMLTEIRSRLDVMSAAKMSTDAITSYGSKVVDNESGLCALARVLKHNDGFIKPGELGFFLFASDENDAGADGSKCIESYENYSGVPEPVYPTGYCATAQTTISYTTPGSAANCKVSWSDSYVVSYIPPKTTANYWRKAVITSNPTSNVSVFELKVPNQYKIKEASVTYTKILGKQYKQTLVNYYKNVCKVLDGINVCENKPFSVVTDSSSPTCSVLVTKVDAAGITNNPALPYTCSVASTRTVADGKACLAAEASYCTTNIDSAPTTKTIVLDFAPATLTACRDAILRNDGSAIVDGSKPTTCTALNGGGFSPTLRSGTCPSTLAETICMPELVSTTLRTKSQSNAGTFTSNTTACDDQGKTITGSYVSASFRPTCTAGAATTTDDCGTFAKKVVSGATYCNRVENLNGFTAAGSNTAACQTFINAKAPGTATGPNMFNATTYPWTCTPVVANSVNEVANFVKFSATVPNTQAVGDTCSTATLNAFLALPTNAGLVTGGTCTIARIDVNSQGNFAKNQATCQAVAVTAAAAKSPYIKNITGVDLTTDINNKIDTNEKILCTTTCAQSKMNFCAPWASMPAGQNLSTITISDYLAQRFGSTSCNDGTKANGQENQKITYTKVAGSDLVNVREADSLNICDKPTLPPQYFVSTYAAPVMVTLSGTKTTYVTGNMVSAGVEVPASNLKDYIQARTSEIFGQGMPLSSAFVLLPTDTPGNNQSVGTEYLSAVAALGGSSESIVSNDYSSTLQSLGEILKNRLIRSFSIAEMSEGQQVHSIFRLDTATGDWNEVDPVNWNAQGNTVTLGVNYPIDVGVRFRVEFY